MFLGDATPGTPLDLSIGTAVFNTPPDFTLPSDIMYGVGATEAQMMPVSSYSASAAAPTVAGVSLDTKTLLILGLLLLFILRR